MPINEAYQGWKNKQTWCVALTLDNTRELYERALEAARDDHPDLALKMLCSSKKVLTEVFNMAEWCWDGHTIGLKLYWHMVDVVDWKELVTHYKTKIKEGC